MAKNRGRSWHKEEKEIEIKSPIESRNKPPSEETKPESPPEETKPAKGEEFTPGPELEDRMMKYRRPQFCPECDARPVICTIKRPGYAAFRCRACDHKWEINF